MNEADFEKKLRVLAGGLRAPDKTALWKSEILARAQREAHRKRLAPPSALVIAWASAWAAIVLLTVATPRTPIISATNLADKSTGTESKQPALHPSGEPQSYASLRRRYDFPDELP